MSTLNNAEPQVDLIGPDLPGRWKFYGGLYSHTAKAIYGIPACAPGVLRIGLPDETIEVIGDLPGGRLEVARRLHDGRRAGLGDSVEFAQCPAHLSAPGR